MSFIAGWFGQSKKSYSENNRIYFIAINQYPTLYNSIKTDNITIYAWQNQFDKFNIQNNQIYFIKTNKSTFNDFEAANDHFMRERQFGKNDFQQNRINFITIKQHNYHDFDIAEDLLRNIPSQHRLTFIVILRPLK